jgi:CubicO group peptidase (beta-lactamase class C family)
MTGDSAVDLQLSEQGKVGLDRDVNTYLAQLRISDPYPQTITIRDLLTHTAGFDTDQREIGGSARTTGEWLPLDRYLAKRALAPMWPPGQRFMYTNAAYDLLGLVVEDVSGQPFSDYMGEHLLRPLEMQRSTFAQPPTLGSDLARTYHYASGQQTVVADGLLLNVPAAGLSATATDVAHFMIAQLHEGRYGETRILQAATAQEMHQSHFTYDPDQPGMAYGFRRALSPRTRNGPREPPDSGTSVLWHEGGGPRAPTSYLQLRPQEGFGLLVAFNSDEFQFLDQVLREFNDHYDPVVSVPNHPTPRQPITGAGDELARFAGIYRPADYSHNTISKLLLLQADDLPQVVVSGNSLGIRWLPDAPGEPDPLVHLEPLVFVSRDSRFRFTFLQDDNQQITGMDWGNLFVLEKVPWYETVTFQRGLFATFLLVFLTTTIALPISALIGHLKNTPARRVQGARRRIAVLAWGAVSVTAGLDAVLLLGLLLVVPRALDLDLQFGMPPLLVALLTIPMLTTALAMGLLLLTVPIWRTPARSNVGKVGYCVCSRALRWPSSHFSCTGTCSGSDGDRWRIEPLGGRSRGRRMRNV